MKTALGIIAAIVAGLAFNAGILIQKRAILNLNSDKAIMRALIKDKTWLSGFILQFVLGTPLYTVSVGLIGPAIVPGLMSIGILSLVWGAVHFYKEKIYIQDILGIVFLCAGVVCLGFSRLYIDVHAQDYFSQGFLLRFSFYCLVLMILFLGFVRVNASAAKSRTSGWNMAAASSAAFNLGNLALGVITYSLVRFFKGDLEFPLIILFSTNVLIIIAANIAGINTMQYALKRGRAVFVVPLQTTINKIFPVTVFFIVYRPYSPGIGSIVLLISGIFSLMISVFLLSTKFKTEEDISEVCKT